MKMNKIKSKILLLVVILIGCSQWVEAQDQAAMRKLKRKAEEFFIDEIFKSALPLFIQLDQIKSGDPEINYKIGVCYLHSEFKNKAIPYFEKAKAKDKEHEYSDIDYYLGVSYHYGHNFDKAIEFYNKYKSTVDSTSDYGKQVWPTINKYIQNCKVGKILLAKPIKAKIDHLNTNINSVYTEAWPIVSADGNTIFFASQRHETSGGQIDDDLDEYYEDMYFSTKSHGKWSKAKHVGPINTFKHDAPLAISADGKRLYFYTSDENGSTDIYYSDNNGSEWSMPMKMEAPINSTSLESGCAISEDGKTFYFASDRPGGYGGMDLYVSTLQADGKWGVPKNLGSKINSAFDEESPSIVSGGNVLYFSSDGPNSIGGLDVFKTKYNPADTSWSAPVNMGYPLNTADHEYHISFLPDGKSGYFSTYRKDTYGEEDIYHFEIFEEEPETKVFAVVDTSMKAPLEKEKIQRPRVGQKLDCIAYFDFNMYSSPSDMSKQKLQIMLALLNQYPELKLEIGGHTDNIGSSEINQVISERRANAMYKFLLSHGIDKKRLKQKGYNFTKLMVNGNSHAENAPNRRVEFKVLSDEEFEKYVEAPTIANPIPLHTAKEQAKAKQSKK
jgi:outer membrane protein OmpA-like peptidoglycan-associated protein/tetratricopeptide (TPR) repeat protein